MATPVTMPKLGLTMNTGTVSRWNKKEGEGVAKGETLMVVATDKLTFEVESPQEGVLLKIIVPEGKDVPVGELLGYLGAAGETLPEGVAPTVEVPPAEKAPEGAPVAATAPKIAAGGKVRATPLAKKIARERGVDMALVPGSGPEGRVVRKDVEAFASASGAQKVKASPVAARAAADLGVDLRAVKAAGRVMKADVLRAASSMVAEDVRIPLTPMRKVIAERMSLSSSTIPAVAYHMEADFTALKEFREKVKVEGDRRGVKISFNHILMKICAAALQDVPEANSTFDGDGITLKGAVNIGLAVSVEGGLLVPNVKAAQNKSLVQIAEETDRLVDQARSGTLALEDMQGGTFTITNLGMFGVDSFTPVINPPEACILGISAIKDKVVVVDGEGVIRPMSVLSLVADHRILDGAEGAAFLARIREYIENPWLLLM